MVFTWEGHHSQHVPECSSEPTVISEATCNHPRPAHNNVPSARKQESSRGRWPRGSALPTQLVLQVNRNHLSGKDSGLFIFSEAVSSRQHSRNPESWKKTTKTSPLTSALGHACGGNTGIYCGDAAEDDVSMETSVMETSAQAQ